jgi:hypothetical protein
MTAAAESLCSSPDGLTRDPDETTVRLIASGTGPFPSNPGRASVTFGPTAAAPDRSRAGSAHYRTVRSWPLLILALPAAVAVWSGWVGIGQMTGFGQVHPLPGIWGSFHLNTAVTLPVGVESYAAYALRAWLSTSNKVSTRTRRFARWSAIGSLLLGMAGQVAYHLLAQSRTTHAPWGVTTAVSCLPVLVLGMGAALAHLLRADACPMDPPDHARSTGQNQKVDGTDRRDSQVGHPDGATHAARLIEARVVAAQLTASGQHVSRRALRRAGIHGSNRELGLIARMVQPPTIETQRPQTRDRPSRQNTECPCTAAG